MVRNWRTVLAKARAGAGEGAGAGAGTLASVSEAVNKAHLRELADHIKSTYPLAEYLADDTEQWQASDEFVKQALSAYTH